MRDLITSAANPSIKRIRSLIRFRKERHRERMFVVEGVRAVADALTHTMPDIILYVPDQLAATERGAALLATLDDHPNAAPISAELLAQLSAVETPQGIIAAVGWPDLRPATTDFVLILDGIQDPGNVGTLLRSAEAAGADLVMCVRGTADVWSPKVVRAGMGVHTRLPLRVDVDWPDVTSTCGATPIYVATQAATRPYDQVDWQQPAALIVGNEAHGVSSHALHIAEPIAIPMHGSTESLNAAVAGSVILFEAARQRRRTS